MISNCIFAVMLVIEWEHGLTDGCGGAYLMNYLPHKNPESIFLSTPKKGRQGLAQLGQLIFCLILCVSISFPIIRLSFWFSFEGLIFFLSFFWVLIFRFWYFFLQFSFKLQGRGGRAPGGKTDLWLFASSLPKTGNGYYWHITSGRGKFIPFL